MLHETLWTAVAVSVTVLGFIIWRYASQNKRNLYTPEALARRTIKKTLNTFEPPATTNTQSYAFKSEPIVHFPVQPRQDYNPRRPSTLDSNAILTRRPITKVATAALPLLDDMPFLTLQPQYQPKPAVIRQTERLPIITYPNETIHSLLYPSLTTTNPVNEVKTSERDHETIPSSVVHTVELPMSEAQEEDTEAVQSPLSRKRTINEASKESGKKTRRDTANKSLVLRAPHNTNTELPQPPEQPKPETPQTTKTDTTQPLSVQVPEKSHSRPVPQQTPLRDHPSPIPVIYTPNYTSVPTTPSSIPSTPASQPWTPYVPSSRDDSKRKKRESLAEQEPASQKRRRVPMFSDTKKLNPITSGILNDTAEEEEREKRVLFILKRAQDAPRTPKEKTPVKSSIVRDSPYKSNTLKLPKLPKYATRRTAVAASSAVPKPSLALVPFGEPAPSEPLKTTTDPSSTKAPEPAPATSAPVLSLFSAFVPGSTALSNPLSTTTEPSTSAPTTTTTTTSTTTTTTNTPNSTQTAPLPILGTPTFGTAGTALPIASTSSILATPTFGIRPSASSSTTASTSSSLVSSTVPGTSTAPIASSSSNPLASLMSSTAPVAFLPPPPAAASSTSAIFFPPAEPAKPTNPNPTVNPATNPTANPTPIIANPFTSLITNPPATNPTTNPLSSTTSIPASFAPPTAAPAAFVPPTLPTFNPPPAFNPPASFNPTSTNPLPTFPPAATNPLPTFPPAATNPLPTFPPASATNSLPTFPPASFNPTTSLPSFAPPTSNPFASAGPSPFASAGPSPFASLAAASTPSIPFNPPSISAQAAANNIFAVEPTKASGGQRKRMVPKKRS